MDQTELSYDAVAPHDQPPVRDVSVGKQSDVEDLLSQATTMANQGSPGAHADEAEQWLSQQMSGMQTRTPAGAKGDPDLVEYGDVKPVSAGKELPFDSVKPFGSVPGKKADFSGVTGGTVPDPSLLSQGVDKVGQYAENATSDISNLFGSAAEYFKNFHAEHETIDAGKVTPQEKVAAKLMGMSSPSASSGVQDKNSPYYDPAAAESHGAIYKMSPEQRQALSDKTLEAWGFTPKEEKERVRKTESGDWSTPDVVGHVLTNTTIPNTVEAALNPQIGNTKKYYALQDTVHAMDVVANPSKYDPKEVKESAALIQRYKRDLGQSGWDSVKEAWNDALANPGKTLKSAAVGFVDPVFAAVPEAKVGSLAMGGRIAKAGESLTEAERIAHLARVVRDSAAANPEIAANAAKNAEVYQRVADRAGLTLKGARRTALLGDLSGTSTSGAGLNAAMSAQEQTKEAGYVKQGSLLAPAVGGAAFGAVTHVLSSGKTLLQDMRERVIPKPTVPEDQPAPDVNAGRRPGEPLHPDTPVSKDGVVPYYGSVDANLNRVHLHKDSPDTLPMQDGDGKMVIVPVKETVTYHEAVEGSLIHMHGPMSEDLINDLEARIGPDHTLSEATKNKLRKGESLPYTNPGDASNPGGHEIATWAENHLVKTMYNVDSKTYQDTLKPHIKEISKSSQKPGAHNEIPETMDTKPYDDVGQGDQLKGKGDRPTIDGVSPGAKEGADNKQKGNINNKLLATGVTVGAGATGGALLAPQGQKEAGAVLGGAAGLFAGINMWGDSISNKGLGNKQRGMFAGPLSRTYSNVSEGIASRMEGAGKTPEQIHAATGMHRIADGKWVHEVDDSRVQLKPATYMAREGVPMPLRDVLDHPELDKAYPGLMDKIKVTIEASPNKGGSYNPATGNITLNDPRFLDSLGRKNLSPKSILTHELQHAIQHLEGFPKGDNPGRHRQQLSKMADDMNSQLIDLRNRHAEAITDGNERYASTLEKEMADLEGRLDKLTPEYISKEASNRYHASAGENQANNVQNRLNMSPEERRQAFPGNTQSVPFGEQRIEYNEEGSPNHQELPPIEEDNYRKPLSTYTDTLYHDTDIRNALPYIPRSRVYDSPKGTYLSNVKDLATGQKGKSGVMLEFDPAGIEGQVNKSKPTWEYSWGQGQAEFVSHHSGQADYQNNLRSITVNKGIRAKAPPVEKMQINRTLQELEGLGWKKTVNPDESTTWSRPQEDLTDHHELPLSEQLKKTGDSDEEGNLHGMSLEEDRLPNESAVVDRAKTGDQRAIADLYRKYMPRLERTLRSVMRDAGPKLGLDSEDIASQAFTKAMQALPHFEGKSAFYTWLYQIGRNEALNAIGKGERQVKTSSMYRAASGESSPDPRSGGIEEPGGSPIRGDVESISGTHDTPEAMATAQQASNMVRHAISKLPQEIREAVKMKDLAGMTEQEIADSQGVPVGTVKSRLSRGRDMIQQSIKRGHGANFRAQGGFATPEALKKLAKVSVLAGVGGTLGAMYLNPEHPLKGAWAGAGIALVAGEVNWGKLFPAFRDLKRADDRFNVNDVLNGWDTAIGTARRATFQAQSAVKELIPDKASQVRVARYLDGDRSITPTAKEYEAAKIARKLYDSIGQAGVDSGVLKDFLSDYINHEWGDSEKAKALQEQVASSFPTNMSPKDRHALARKFMTLEQGKAAGLTPKTENVLELMGIYSDSMTRAMANKTLIESLKDYKLDTAGKVNAMMPAGKAPYNYVAINHPQLGAVRVHPSIAPSLDFLFHMKGGPNVVQALEAVNTAIKRTQVSFSMFHVKALIDAHLGANTLMGTFKNLVDIAQSAVGKSDYHKMYKSGGLGDAVDMGIKGGLTTDMGGHITDEDIRGNSLYDALDHTSKFMDSVVPGSGVIAKAIKKANKVSDKFIWENVHAGLKGMTFMNVYERMSRSWATEALNNPNAKVLSPQEIATHAASFVNDTFGGLNWRRLADDATTKYGRSLALALASPAGRRLSQVMLFAPDWTYSTIRSFAKGMGQGSGLKGLLQPKYMADLHRQYVIRSAFIYLTLYNAVNMAMSGHPIWENKDPLTVDLGNGETMQANKHFMEVPHMLANPAKFLLGKIGTAPSEVIDQLTHKDYINGPEMKVGRIEHAASRLLPFSAEDHPAQGTPERIMNALGFPIQGGRNTGPMAEEAAQERHEERVKASKKGAETRRAKKYKEMYGE